jgi:hypothetical protein
VKHHGGNTAVYSAAHSYQHFAVLAHFLFSFVAPIVIGIVVL